MDVAMEWYYAVPLLFTALAVVLASVFVKLRSTAGDKGTERAAAAAKEEGEEEPEVTEAKANAAADREDGGEKIQGGQEQTEEDGEGPPKSEVDEEVRDKGERVLEEETGTERKKKDDKQEQHREGEGEGAASRTAKAEPQSHPPEMKVPSQTAASAVAATAAVEEDEQEDDEDEEDSKEEDQESETEKPVVREPESENVDEQFSFKYSPGKLRGNQYKTLLTKEELEEEQRTEDYMKLSLDSS